MVGPSKNTNSKSSTSKQNDNSDDIRNREKMRSCMTEFILDKPSPKEKLQPFEQEIDFSTLSSSNPEPEAPKSLSLTYENNFCANPKNLQQSSHRQPQQSNVQPHFVQQQQNMYHYQTNNYSNTENITQKSEYFSTSAQASTFQNSDTFQGPVNRSTSTYSSCPNQEKEIRFLPSIRQLFGSAFCEKHRIQCSYD